LTASDYSVGISLDGAGGNDSITGGKADDTISGGSGSNTVVGGTGNDLMILNDLTSSIVGGVGSDTVQFADSGTTIQDADLAQFKTVEILQATAGNNNFILGANATLAGIQTVFGADGNDSIDASALGTAYGISLVGGNGKNTLVGGGSNDSLTGGAGNDSISGNAGDDTIIGGGGADNLSGGAGYDTFIFTTNNLATTRVDGGASDTLGYDTILFTQAGVTITDSAFSNVASVERLQLGSGDNSVAVGSNAQLAGLKKIEGGIGRNTLSASGYDSSSSIILDASAAAVSSLVGGEGADILQGGAGADTLDGGGGGDAMNGGAGSDTYYLRQTTDSISEFDGDGTADRVLSWLNYTPINFVERVDLQGTANLSATGHFLRDGFDAVLDTLIGNSGNNVLDDGKAIVFFGNIRPYGSIMQGGAGDDTYIVHSQYTEITDTQGNDAIEAFVSYTLPGGSVKRITLVNGAANALSATGSGQSETLIGNALANTLDGGGGADTMVGGLGNDIYVVDDSGDILTEAVNQGIDVAQIRSGGNITNSTTFITSFILADGNNVENLHYISQSGTAFLTGNELDNSILGGRSNDTLRGGAFGNDTLNGAGGDDYMAGGYGNDYYQVDSANDVVVEQANAGTDTVDSEVSYTLAGGVENLILSGSGNLDGTGNIDANAITGNNQNNRLDGLFGEDNMRGLAGDDIYVVDNVGDIVDERDANGADAGGIDIVFSSVDFNLETNSQGSIFLENLVLTGSADINGTGNSDGNAAGNRPDNNSLTGNAGINILTGAFGNDTIDGGSGADNLIGLAGNDVYVVDNIGDVIVEALNAGTDTVHSSITYNLAANVENLTLTGSSIINGTGNALNNLIIGNGAVNALIGGAGDDTLDGANGADVLTGGIGNDVYLIDNTGDMAIENLGEGTEAVRSSISITILFANIENLIHTGLANLSSSGNGLDNIMTGNEGIDTLRGGLGNDTYVLNNSADRALETAAQGTDEVQSTVTYELSDEIEILRLIGLADIHASGTGNESDNTLYGNIGHNSLDGKGGNDLMIGGAGNDTYFVGAVGDVVNEFSNQGTDTVESTITYTLGSDLENLILSGSTALNGTGNVLANAISGNSGNNILDGGIGTNGVDTLTGNSGNDTFVLANAAGSYYNSSGDLDYAVITDFSAGDQLQLKNGDYFTGSLDGTAAQSWHAQAFSGLFIDSDGSGAFSANDDLVAVIKSNVVETARTGAIKV
jgi:Ca2+-binding RTX toxin-like protein